MSELYIYIYIYIIIIIIIKLSVKDLIFNYYYYSKVGNLYKEDLFRLAPDGLIFNFSVLVVV